ESLVSFANIMHESHHAFGRAGFGAVMGSKNLKAIVTKASGKDMDLADEQKYEELRKAINPRIKNALMSEVLREYGTSGALEGHVYNGDVPIKNWTSNFSEEMAEALTGSTLAENYATGSSTCAYCSIACKKNVEVKDGPFAVPKGAGPEYETIVAFGCLMDSKDLAAACKAGRLCNDFGMDTISAGATIAWAMEAFECGDLTVADTGGVVLEWADMDTVVHTVLPAIARREGKIGKLLSRGSFSAAKKTGGNSLQYTAHSKGLEVPMHDPRGGGHGKALAYAVSPRGGCHVSNTMHFIESGACYYPEIGFDYDLEPMTEKDKAEVAVVAFELGNIENSACFCQFADRQLTIPDWVGLFNAVAGYGWDAQDMLKAGRRAFYLKRLLNYRYGATADDDSLTPRMLEPARDGEPEGIVMNFDAMKEKFYSLIGFDTIRGIPERDVLCQYDMHEEADIVW
ncbi:MAG TPA: aldehyde ferredoxin oxidoreductase C-terminal domain-containing protein, partial [Spirochaetota bacterium]|nr:aldehyde ferredoxin oxidoreductase C-terminal domain-containing protein [Spirochaetota bacterium]